MHRLNIDVLELQTAEDGQRMILFDYKLGAEVAILFNDIKPSNVATKVILLKFVRDLNITIILGLSSTKYIECAG